MIFLCASFRNYLPYLKCSEVEKIDQILKLICISAANV